MWGIARSLGYVTMFGFDTVYDFLSRSMSRKIETDHMASNFWKAATKARVYEEFGKK
jgi:hypothetical protein